MPRLAKVGALAGIVWGLTCAVSLADPVIVGGNTLTSEWEFGHGAIRVGSDGAWEIGTGSSANNWTNSANHVANVSGGFPSGSVHGFTLSFDSGEPRAQPDGRRGARDYATGMNSSPTAILIDFEGSQSYDQSVFLTNLAVDGTALDPSGLSVTSFDPNGSHVFWTLTNLTNFGTLTGSFQFDYTFGAGFKPSIQFALGGAPSSVPDPASLLLVGVGLVGVGLLADCRKN